MGLFGAIAVNTWLLILQYFKEIKLLKTVLKCFAVLQKKNLRIENQINGKVVHFNLTCEINSIAIFAMRGFDVATRLNSVDSSLVCVVEVIVRSINCHFRCFYLFETAGFCVNTRPYIAYKMVSVSKNTSHRVRLVLMSQQRSLNSVESTLTII